MIVYEVTATVEPQAAEAYAGYLRERHVRDVLATGCFLSATVGVEEDGRFQVRYVAADRTAVERYVAEHAPRLRQDALLRFPSGVQLTRAIWEIVAEWTAPR